MQPPPGREVTAGRIDERTGAVRSLFGLRDAAPGGTPEATARAYLDAAQEALGLERVVPSLQHLATRRGLGTRHVMFRQTFGGVPVYGSEVVVSLHDERGEVTAVMSGAEPDISLPSIMPSLSGAQAASIAVGRLAPGGAAVVPPAAELMIHSRSGVHRLAYRVLAVMSEPRGDWEVFVDATTGEPFSIRDRLCYVHGSGLAFHPDPITQAEVPYETPGYADDANATTAQLDSIRVRMPLYDITEFLGSYLLSGPAVSIFEFPGPDGAPGGDEVTSYAQSDPNGFDYTRDQPGFEAVMIYAHMANLQQWIQHLGFTDVNNDQDPADPHALGGAANAAYWPTQDAFTFGEGGVDTGEDATIIAHEYGHAIHHNQVPDWGRFLEGGAMGEGFGDYLGAGYAAAEGLYQADWVAKWGGQPALQGTDPGLRSLVSNKTYPDSLADEVHDDGQIWSACLWQIHSALGRRATDTLVIQSHFYLTPGATFRDGALALLQADVDLNGGVNDALIRGIFTARGILRPVPFLVAMGPANQFPVSLSFDRRPKDSTGVFGRHVLAAYSSDGMVAVRRIRASGAVVPGASVSGLADEFDVACAPVQPVPPTYLLVGTIPGVGDAPDIAGSFVTTVGGTTGPVFPIVTSPEPEGQVAIGAIDSTYCVAFVRSLPGGGQFVIAQLLNHDSTIMAAVPFAGLEAQSEPAVCGGRNPLTGAPEFLVAWMEATGPPGAEFGIRAQRIGVDGAPLGPVLFIADGIFADLSHFTPAIAFDGLRYLVVWTRVSFLLGTSQIWACHVNPLVPVPEPGFMVWPGPAGTNPDVAFAGEQYLVVWYSASPFGPVPQDVFGRRIAPGPLFVDPMPIAIAATPLVEQRPSVTQIGGDAFMSRGQGFVVAWCQSPPAVSDFDVWATLVPESLGVTVPPPDPLPLSVGLTAPPDTTVAPGTELVLLFTAGNAGEIKDAYRVTLLQSEPWPAALMPDFVVLDPSGSAPLPVILDVPPDADPGDFSVVTLVAVSVTDSTVTAIEDVVVTVGSDPTGVAVRPAFALLPSTPNPFRASTRIRFSLARDEAATVDIFDVGGRLVRRLTSAKREAGPHIVTWDGSEADGAVAASGVYFCRLKTADREAVRTILRVR